MGVAAVIWDFGGVFTTSPFEAFNRFEIERGLPANFIRTINSANPDSNAWARFERAEIDRDDFDQLFLEESSARGYPVRGAHILPLLSGELRPRMVQALLTCKRHFKVGCITNNMQHGHGSSMATTPEASSKAVGVMRHFDAIIESSKTGLRKPNPKVYLMMCELLGVAASACVYLDDLGINCKPAAQLGMKAIKVVTEAQTLEDLTSASGLKFD